MRCIRFHASSEHIAPHARLAGRQAGTTGPPRPGGPAPGDGERTRARTGTSPTKRVAIRTSPAPPRPGESHTTPPTWSRTTLRDFPTPTSTIGGTGGIFNRSRRSCHRRDDDNVVLSFLSDSLHEKRWQKRRRESPPVTTSQKCRRSHFRVCRSQKRFIFF
jgi:hypothetical protein